MSKFTNIDLLLDERMVDYFARRLDAYNELKCDDMNLECYINFVLRNIITDMVNDDVKSDGGIDE